MKRGRGEQTGQSRYVVGFDLGTTNSAVCFVDTHQSPWRVETFAVPQLVAPGQVEARETLPSFHYQPAAGEFSAEALQLPWQGSGFRVQGSEQRGEGRGKRGRRTSDGSKSKD